MSSQDAGLPRDPKGNIAVLRDNARTAAARTPEFAAANFNAAASSAGVALNSLVELRGLLKHRRTILATLAVCLTLGVLVTLLMRPMYTAQATLQLDREAERVVSRDDQTPVDNYGGEFFQTQYGLLKSRALASRVAESLGLAANGDFLRAMAGRAPEPAEKLDTLTRRQAVGEFLRKGLGVEPVRGSRLVNVTFASPDPALSARIANAFAENFIGAAIERRFESSSYARDFLEKRLAEVKGKLEQSERELVAYAAQQQIIQLSNKNAPSSTDPGPSLPAANLEAFNTALAAAKTERIRAEQKWKAASAVTGVGLPDILQNPTIQELSQQRAKMQAEYQDRLAVYKPDYPDMLQLKARIDETQHQIDVESANIRQAIHLEYQAALDNERALESQVNSLKASVLDLRGRSIRYTILQREVDTNRALYDGLLQRYKEVGVAGGVSSNNISIIDRATPPRRPSSPKPLINLLVAAVLGLGSGTGLAWLRMTFDQAVRTPADVEALGVTVLGTVPDLGKNPSVIETLADVRSPLAEAYQSLRSALQFATVDGFPDTMLVTSPWQGEGKSTTAYTVAKFAARLGYRVLLVDADLRKPSLQTLLGGDNTLGMTDVLTGGAVLKDAIQPTAIENLSLIAAGPASPNPAELLSGPRLKLQLAEAKGLFDAVIIDGPPVMALADAPLIGSLTTATLIVLEAGRTTRPQALDALARLNLAGAQIVGAVLTRYKASHPAVGLAHEYGYGYGYGYDYGQATVSLGQRGGRRDSLIGRTRRLISR